MPSATVSNLGESPPEVQILTDPVSVRVATTSDPTSASVSVAVYDDFVDAAGVVLNVIPNESTGGGGTDVDPPTDGPGDDGGTGTDVPTPEQVRASQAAAGKAKEAGKNLLEAGKHQEANLAAVSYCASRRNHHQRVH